MLEITSSLDEIESSQEVYKIEVNNIKLWPYLRYFVANSLLKSNKIPTYKIIKKNKLKTKIQKIINLKYGFFNFFKPCEALFIATSKERRLRDNISISKNINEIYKNYEKALLIEHPFEDKHFDIKSVSEKNIMSLCSIQVLSSLIRKLNFLNYKISGDEVISSINKKYGIMFDLKSKCKEFYSNYYVFKLLLKIKKPKILYISVWYGYGPIVKAAKDLGITTVEVQHGSFQEGHYSYNMKKIVDSSHYPEYILTFSQNYSDFLNRSELKKNNIFKPIAVGSYLENVKKETLINKNRFRKFKFIVSMSATVNASYIEYDFLLKISKQMNNVLFIYLPRRENQFKNTKNLFVAKKFTAIDYLPISNLHITSRSTCMFEAAFLEIKTLIYTPLIELEEDKKNLKKRLNQYRSLYRFIEDNDDLIFIIKEELEKKNDINIHEINKLDLYKVDYNNNIKKFIDKISKKIISK